MLTVWRKLLRGLLTILAVALVFSVPLARADQATDAAAIVAKNSPPPAPAPFTIGHVTVTPAHILAGQNATDIRCHALPVQDGYGARAPGQPSYGLPPSFPACDFPPTGAPAGTDLNNNGGPVLTSAVNYLIALNQPNFATHGDPYTFLTDLFATPTDIIHLADQYVGSTANNRYSASSNGASTTYSVPHTMSPAQLGAAVTSAVQYFFPSGGGGGYDKLYHIFLPAGQDACLDPALTQCYSPDVPSTHKACAWHTSFNTTDKNGASIHVIYSVEPMEAVTGCTFTGPLGNPSDSTNKVLSHETFEAITDPDYTTGWIRNSDNQEIGDICNSASFVVNPITLNGKAYAIQSEYSNATHLCAAAVGAKPANDNFLNAIAISAGQTLTGTSVGAIKELGEPNHGGRVGGASVWWKFTAPGNGKVAITTAGSNYDTVLGVYTGSAVNGLTSVAQNDDCNNTRQSCVSFNATSGTIYHIAVDGYLGARGNITLAVSLLAGSATHDFNGDHKSDVLWRHSGGSVSIWQMNGGTVSSSLVVGSANTSWQIVGTASPASGTGDIDGDGNADIFWVHPGAGNIPSSYAVWELNGGTIKSQSGLGEVDAAWKIAAIGDFDGDGRADIVWRHTNGTVAIWEMSGFTLRSSISLGAVPTDWQIAGIGDFDGDGRADLLWVNTNGSVAIWEMSGLTVKATFNVGTLPAGWSIAGVGDFDGDGKADILLRHSAGGVAIWEMNGGTIKAPLGVGAADPAWQIVSTGDYDGDGMADILLRHSAGGVAVWLMNGNTIKAAAGLGAPATAWTIVE
jgi:hypothetical protein